MQKIELEEAWAFFPIQAQSQVQSFAMAVETVIGNGKKYLFLVRLLAAWSEVKIDTATFVQCNSSKSKKKNGL